MLNPGWLGEDGVALPFGAELLVIDSSKSSVGGIQCCRRGFIMSAKEPTPMPPGVRRLFYGPDGKLLAKPLVKGPSAPPPLKRQYRD